MGIRGIDICLGHYYLVVFDRVADRVFIWMALKKKKKSEACREEARKMDKKSFTFHQYMDRI
jgi:hypothetical protein